MNLLTKSGQPSAYALRCGYIRKVGVVSVTWSSCCWKASGPGGVHYSRSMRKAVKLAKGVASISRAELVKFLEVLDGKAKGGKS